ncbi:YpjP family protein [Virgibacillus ainsalahensis]
MKLWMRKAAVALITIMTLGLYTPTAFLPTEAEESNEPENTNEGVSNTVEAVETDASIAVELENDEADAISTITEKAKKQTLLKLGPKIANQVEDEFSAVILPKMEQVLKTIMSEAGEDEVAFYEISEDPSPGVGERIFNIYDYRSEEKIAKFHVRRDNRPMEGYWFNFHYHLSDDNFAEHHEIGEIYWDKNIPPKWMA